MYLREIVEEHRVLDDITHYRERYPGFDDFYQAMTGKLSENPRIGDPLSYAPDFRLYTTVSTNDAPAFNILYTFDENKVYLHSIQPVQPE
ncbi:MAG: hypothetical protein ABI700_23115 [Chloroflexota bacterium]